MTIGHLKHIERTVPLLLLVLLFVAGCDDDDGKNRNPSAATPTPTATPQATPTATEPPEPPHSIMEVGSTELNGGALTVSDMPVAFVVPSACLGGTGDECEGGTIVYSGTSPGFDDVDEDDSELPIYRLPDGVEVTIELTSVDADASLLISGVILDEVGEMAVVNTSPELHNHPTWQIVAPGGEHPADKRVTFRLHGDGFDSSAEIAITLSLFEGEDHHEEGPPHSIMRVGSTELDDGALTVDQVPVAFVVASACLGGTGDQCDGGTVVYSGTSPGFNNLTDDDPEVPIYRLPDGVEVTIELTAVDADAGVLISGVLLDVPGESAVVNTTPELHNHPTWQIVATGGEDPTEKHLTFRLHAAGFDPSAEIPLTLMLFDDEADGHDHDEGTDGHDDDD